MFSAAYLDLPFSPLVALIEVVDVDMLNAQSQHEASQVHTQRTNLCLWLLRRKGTVITGKVMTCKKFQEAKLTKFQMKNQNTMKFCTEATIN